MLINSLNNNYLLFVSDSLYKSSFNVYSEGCYGTNLAVFLT